MKQHVSNSPEGFARCASVRGRVYAPSAATVAAMIRNGEITLDDVCRHCRGRVTALLPKGGV